MNSVIQEIFTLREGRPFAIDRRNRNRYRIVVLEPDGRQTAYYFGTPVYNCRTGDMVNIRFSQTAGGAVFTGSNATVTVSETVQMENENGKCVFDFGIKECIPANDGIHCGTFRIRPTLNGITVRTSAVDKRMFSFEMETEYPFNSIRENDRCVAFMTDRFRPFVTISCIGTVDGDNADAVLAPAVLEYRQTSVGRYRFTVSPTVFTGTGMMFEVNMYEPKLFQDTTVESLHPKMNNAFGGIAFIGNTSYCGEQWLYTRPDYEKLKEVMGRQIDRVVMWLPRHRPGNVRIAACGIQRRFCSFGSDWQNKVTAFNRISTGENKEKYCRLDITEILLREPGGTLVPNEGFILRSAVRDSGFSVISTGDSYYAPEILAIMYR